MYIKRLLFISTLFFLQGVHAGGVSLGATRVVYPTDKDQVVLKVYNTDESSNYLVQSWVTDANGNKTSDFIVTPPLFVINAKSDSLLNIVFTKAKNSLLSDREQLYYLNSKVIPSLSEEQKKIDNALLISTTTNIKIFYRPSNIKMDSFTSYTNLSCSYVNDGLKINNPTPFYMNLSSLRIGGKEVSQAATIAPKSDFTLKTADRSKKLNFDFINDYGVQKKDIACIFK